MAEIITGDFMGETELDRAIARVKELERENRALWYACGKFREVAGSAASLVGEANRTGGGPETDGKEFLVAIAAADKVLGDIVPLMLPK